MKLNIEMVAEDDIPPDDAVLVCVPYGYAVVPGSLTGTCSKCGRMIEYSPNSPAIATKVCAPCAFAKMKDEEVVDLRITEKQLKEWKEHGNRD
jgi:hypothetical protein